VLIFVFLQYNRVFIATVNAYVSPGAIDPQNIVIDPTGDTNVSADPRLVIPKINVDVPVVYDIGPDYNSQMAAMEKGVAHFGIPGANSRPGELGNTVLSGHSSNDLFDGGDYKFIFAQLDKLNTGDTIYANYGGVRYTYVVTKKEVVKPTEVSKLVYPTTKPVLTLITCTPLGTSQNRLLVTAEQVSPDPAKAAAAPVDSGAADSDAAIPGNSPTLFERLFGAR
jgi:sortase A